MPHHTENNPNPYAIQWVETQIDAPANIVILSSESITNGHRVLCQDLLTTASIDGRSVQAFQLSPKEETWIGDFNSIVINDNIVDLQTINTLSSTEFEKHLHRGIKRYLSDVDNFASSIVFIDHIRLLEDLFREKDAKRILDTVTELITRKGHVAYYRYPCDTHAQAVPEHLSGLFDYSISPNLELTGWQIDAIE